MSENNRPSPPIGEPITFAQFVLDRELRDFPGCLIVPVLLPAILAIAPAPFVWLLMVAVGLAPMTWKGLGFNWLIFVAIFFIWGARVRLHGHRFFYDIYLRARLQLPQSSPANSSGGESGR